MTEAETKALNDAIAQGAIASAKAQAVTDAMPPALKTLNTLCKALVTSLLITTAASAHASNPQPPVVTLAMDSVSSAPIIVHSADAREPAVVALAAFNNGNPANGTAWYGATNGNGKNDSTGWPTTGDIKAIIALGVKTIRLPIQPNYCLLPDGTLNRWVIKYLAGSIKLATSQHVSIVLEAHTYLPFTDPKVASFWSLFAPAMEKAIGGPSPMFGIELSNEPGSSSKDLAAWTSPLRVTIADIRNAGYQGYIFAGAGDWNNATFLPLALATIVKPTAVDPLNRTIYTMHDYWQKDRSPAKTRNDRGAAVDGTINIAKRYDPALKAARKLGVKIVMSEIGGGISPNGPLPAFNGVGKNGAQLEAEYFAYAKANRDVLLGSWFWSAGKFKPDYVGKVAAGNPHTIALQGFW